MEIFIHCLFRKYKPVKSHNSNFFTLPNFWFVKKNFFARNFANGVTESGIYQLPDKNPDVAKIKMEYYISFKEIV